MAGRGRGAAGSRAVGEEVVVVALSSKPLPLFWTGRHRFFVFSMCFKTLRTTAGMLRALKRGMKNLDLNAGYEDPIR